MPTSTASTAGNDMTAGTLMLTVSPSELSSVESRTTWGHCVVVPLVGSAWLRAGDAYRAI